MAFMKRLLCLVWSCFRFRTWMACATMETRTCHTRPLPPSLRAAPAAGYLFGMRRCLCPALSHASSCPSRHASETFYASIGIGVPMSSLCPGPLWQQRETEAEISCPCVFIFCVDDCRRTSTSTTLSSSAARTCAVALLWCSTAPPRLAKPSHAMPCHAIEVNRKCFTLEIFTRSGRIFPFGLARFEPRSFFPMFCKLLLQSYVLCFMFFVWFVGLSPRSRRKKEGKLL